MNGAVMERRGIDRNRVVSCLPSVDDVLLVPYVLSVYPTMDGMQKECHAFLYVEHDSHMQELREKCQMADAPDMVQTPYVKALSGYFREHGKEIARLLGVPSQGKVTVRDGITFRVGGGSIIHATPLLFICKKALDELVQCQPSEKLYEESYFYSYGDDPIAEYHSCYPLEYQRQSP